MTVLLVIVYGLVMLALGAIFQDRTARRSDRAAWDAGVEYGRTSRP